MYLKRFLLSIVSFSACGTILAQDRIFKSNGDVIESNIKNVGTRMITYVRHSNPNGPEYVIPKDEVDKIKYENGSEENFMRGSNASNSQVMQTQTRRSHNEELKGKYNPNIIAFAPIQFTEAGIAGFSFSYERALDKNNIVAFYVPAILEFNPNNNYRNNYNYYGTYYSTNNATDAMFYIMPGIKLYPTGGYGVAKYAIGPSLVAAVGTKTDYNNYYTTSTGYYNPMSQSHSKLGMIINQSININPTPHLYLGSELGLGFTYINSIGGFNSGTQGLVQFSFKVGYRF